MPLARLVRRDHAARAPPHTRPHPSNHGPATVYADRPPTDPGSFFLPRTDSADDYSECGGDADVELDDEAERGEDDADAADGQVDAADGQADATGALRCTRQRAQAAAMNATGVLRRQRHCVEHTDAGVCMCGRRCVYVRAQS